MNIDGIKNLLDNLDKKNLNEKISRNIYALRVIRLPQLEKYNHDPEKLKDITQKTLRWLKHICNLANETSIQT